MATTARPAAPTDAPAAARPAPRPSLPRLRRHATRVLAFGLCVAAASGGAYELGARTSAPEGPAPLGFAAVPPTHATFSLSGTCTAPPCADVLTAHQSRFAMTDGTTWMRVVYHLGDATWTEWRDGARRRIDPSRIPPLPRGAS